MHHILFTPTLIHHTYKHSPTHHTSHPPPHLYTLTPTHHTSLLPTTPIHTHTQTHLFNIHEILHSSLHIFHHVLCWSEYGHVVVSNGLHSGSFSSSNKTRRGSHKAVNFTHLDIWNTTSVQNSIITR